MWLTLTSLLYGSGATLLLSILLVLYFQLKYGNYSVVYLGKTRAYEAEVDKLLGLKLSEFLPLLVEMQFRRSACERAGTGVWDTPSIDMINKFPNFFLSHMVRAMALKMQGRNEEADKAYTKAKALVVPTHPLSYLMATEEEWNLKPIESKISEEAKDWVWRIEGNLPSSSPFPSNIYGYLFRLQSGELIYINPIPSSGQVKTQIDQIGNVTHLISTSGEHGKGLRECLKIWPKAKICGVPSHSAYADIKFDMILNDSKQLFPDELEFVIAEGHKTTESMFYHHRTRALVLTDIAYGSSANDPFFIKLWTFGLGNTGGLRPDPKIDAGLSNGQCYHSLFLKDGKKLSAAFSKVLKWDFSTIYQVHSGGIIRNNEAKRVFKNVTSWVHIYTGISVQLFMGIRFLKKYRLFGIMPKLLAKPKKKPS